MKDPVKVPPSPKTALLLSVHSVKVSAKAGWAAAGPRARAERRATVRSFMFVSSFSLEGRNLTQLEVFRWDASWEVCRGLRDASGVRTLRCRGGRCRAGVASRAPELARR